MVWGYEACAWLNQNGYMIQVAWLVFRNTKEKYQIHRFSPPRLQQTEVSKATPVYIYTPLSTDRNIRLLLLHRRHPDDHVRCSLIETPLNEAPKFEAMSYTWGGQDSDFKVILDDKAISVTANAFNLLRDLSSYLFPRLLWIDSICIDQENTDEKTRQVRLMGEIYRSASLVTVWLSTGRARQSALEEYANSIDAIMVLDLVKELQLLGLSQSSNLSLYRRLSAQRRTPRWEALMKMLEHTWFERTWIVQEVVLASNIRVLYGRVGIDWQSFADSLTKIMEIAPNLPEWTSDFRVRTQSRAFKLFNLTQIQRCRRDHQRNDKTSFVGIACATRRFQARDARDKVFGIQGLCGKGSQDWTLPDYSKNLPDVYIDAALRIIHEEGIPRTISNAGIGYFNDSTPGLKSLPSWVPDWSRASFCANLAYWSPDLDYKAGGSADSTAHILLEKTLHLSGYFLDAIEELAPQHNVFTSGVDTWNINQIRNVIGAHTASRNLILNSPYTTFPYAYTQEPESVEEVLWRLLVGNRTFKERPAPSSLVQGYLHYLQSMKNVEEVIAQDRNPPATEEQILAHSSASEYGQLTMRGWAGRRVCVTRKGYVGLVPPLTMIGDVIVIIVGAQTPFVLRAAGTKRSKQLVGECYVHGVMDGEALIGCAQRNIFEIL
jgi:hypothetical protein